MKSIRQKAKAYDKALEIARHYYEEAIKLEKIASIEFLESMFDELRNNDEKIRKEIIDYIKTGTYREDWTAWLEKQYASIDVDSILNKVGIKPAYKDGNAWCILYGDNIQDGVCGFGYTKEEALIEFLKDLLEKQDEQKHFEQDIEMVVKPKFKVGDWIVYNDNVYQIHNIGLKKYYECLRTNGTVHTFDFEYIDSKSHLWTIQDAKEGDILVNDSVICVYKERVSEHVIKVTINYSRREDIETHYEVIGDFNLYPATKEERDFFFSKLKSEVGV